MVVKQTDPKKQRSVTLTDAAWEQLGELAWMDRRSRSEYIELMVRHLYQQQQLPNS